MGRMLENKFYAMKHQEKCKQITKPDRIKKNEIYSVLILQMTAVS